MGDRVFTFSELLEEFVRDWGRSAGTMNEAVREVAMRELMAVALGRIAIAIERIADRIGAPSEDQEADEPSEYAKSVLERIRRQNDIWLTKALPLVRDAIAALHSQSGIPFSTCTNMARNLIEKEFYADNTKRTDDDYESVTLKAAREFSWPDSADEIYGIGYGRAMKSRYAAWIARGKTSLTESGETLK